MNKNEELDAELAEKLHGWTRDHTGFLWIDDEGVTHEDPPRSTDWRGAGKVLSAMAKLGYDYEITLRKDHLTACFTAKSRQIAACVGQETMNAQTAERSSGFGCSPPDLPYVVAASAARALRWKNDIEEDKQ